MMKLENLYPERVFYYFEKLTEIPHGSRNTKQKGSMVSLTDEVAPNQLKK